MRRAGGTSMVGGCLLAVLLCACRGESDSPSSRIDTDTKPSHDGGGAGGEDARSAADDVGQDADDPMTAPAGGAASPSKGGAASLSTRPNGGVAGDDGAAPTGVGAGGRGVDVDGTSGASPVGGASSTGRGGTGSSNGGESAGAAAGGAPATTSERPCDLYLRAGTPCVGAYSPIRTLSSDYDGPLYQVRSGSTATNRGTGGETHDIGTTPDGFADAEAVDAFCTGTLCTVSLLYDQSGRGNHLPLSKQPSVNSVPPNFYETVIRRDDGKDALTVAGHRVYSLYMEPSGGYSLSVRGDGVPFGSEAQGVYLLADGTHTSPACCWVLGNVSTDLERGYESNTLMLGIAYWGYGEGAGPWFLSYNGSGVLAGGTNPGDPGWGAFDGNDPVMNPDNPSLAVSRALGFLKTDQDGWQLRMANATTMDGVHTAYAGGLPVEVDNEGAIVLGAHALVGESGAGTLFEGAVVAGFPSDDTDLEVLQNIQAAGYGSSN